jgi:beta-galactosidase/beta-glucuronidase
MGMPEVGAQGKSVPGDFGSRVEDYFKIMSTAVFSEDDKE